MLLTLYYGLTTWIQSRRLSTIQSGIKNIFDFNCSIVMIVEDRMTQGESKCGLIIHQDGISSQCCKNRNDARVGDLLWFSRSRLCFTIFPKMFGINMQDGRKFFNYSEVLHQIEILQPAGMQDDSFEKFEELSSILNGNSRLQFQQNIEITSWINFDFEKPFFPIEIASNSNFTPELLSSARILIEAGYYENNCSDCTICEIHHFGVPMVWRADTKFYMILETDLEHLAKLAYNFKMNHLVIDEFLMILRIESVETEGQPCLLLDADCTYDLQYSSPKEVKIFEDSESLMNPKFEQLRGLSLAAAEAVTSCQHVFAPDRTYRVIVPANTKVSKQLSVTEQSSDSFTSCVQELESALSQDKDQNIQDEQPTQIASPQDSKSSDSFVSVGSASTVSLVSHVAENHGQSTVQPVKNLSTKFSVEHIVRTKPTNIIVYSESAVTLENVKAVLQETLNCHRYTIYGMSEAQLTIQPWASKTSLLVVCGSVPPQLASQFIGFLLAGGKMLCLCSDLLHLVLPSFRTAEVREKELVCFSYGKWKQVHLMHHIFCYHASPARAHFSETSSRLNAPKTPPSVEVLDSNNKAHTLHVEVLGAEETWHSPSLLLATVETSKGKVIFSQVHLEVNPGQYEMDDSNYAVLQKSNATRLEILHDILSVHLDLDCTKACAPSFTPAFFLGRHELKLALLQELKLQSGNTHSLPKMSLRFCGKDVIPAAATENFLPIYIHACPANFSTVEYFENLDSETLGRLVLYSEVLASCMDVLHGGIFQHGLAVVAREQTRGKGRGDNVWLSPKGCAMFSLQLHIGLQSYLAQHISLLQHIVSLALVSGIHSISGYEVLNLKLKWPNDIYIGNEMKLGGVVISTLMDDSKVVCNIGCAINLDNLSPTICVNDLIQKHNREKKQNLPLLSYEKFLAFTFTKLETLLTQVEVDVSSIINLYYSYWLHSDADVLLMDSNNCFQNVTVQGIDQCGFLSVKTESGSSFTVHPDNNSFDILSGLITPKCF